MSGWNAEKAVLYVQLAGGICACVSILWVYSGIEKAAEESSTATRVQTLHATSNAHGYDKSTLEVYLLRPRLMLWLRQICTIGLILMNVLVLCVNGRVGTDVYLNEEVAGSMTSSELVVYFSSHALFIGSLCALMFLDDLSNLSKKRVQQAWLPPYLIVFVQVLIVFFCTGTTSCLVQLLMAVGVLIFASCTAFIDKAYPQVNQPTPEYTCGLFASLTFSHINENIIIPTMKRVSMEFEHVPKLSDADSSHEVWKRFSSILLSSKELNLWYSVYQLVKWEWLAQGFFQFMGSSANYITPLALERILLHITNHGRDDDAVEALIPISVELAVVLLFIGPLLSCIGDGQNYVRGRHIGIRVKGALIAAIYNKALSVDLTASKESVGKLNNLISVDVSDIQDFCCYSHYIWSTGYEILFSSSLLFLVLGKAAFGGLSVMVFSLAVGISVSKIVEHYQNQLLKCKDSRMGIVNEVLNSMRVIKYYAWERKFAAKINRARHIEVDCLRAYTVTNAALYAFWEVVPAIVGATAFILHTYYLGKPLSPATGFTALTLFNLLRFPLDVFPEMLNYLVRTKVSLKRIESFLRTPDVKGITDACAGVRSADGLSHPDLGSIGTTYADHVFAPRAYPVYTTPDQLPIPLPPQSDRTTSILDRQRASSANQPPAGTVVLSNLKLAWAPTLREDDSDVLAAQSKIMSCYDLSRFCSRKSAPKSASALPPLPQKKQAPKYEPLATVEEESVTLNPTCTTDLGSPFALQTPAVEFSAEELPEERSRHSYITGDSHLSAFSNSIPQTASPRIEIPTRKRTYSGLLVPESGTSSSTVILENTTFTIPQGALAVVVGVTGSGKSSLLQGALLGEALHLVGTAAVGGRISYASQSAWIQNATLRDNVLFGMPFNQERYDAVVYSCALLSDFKLLPLGDMTEIGEKGVNLSGGQQQRVSLARAAYAASDVVLLDDPLSAVDTVVGEHIFKELVMGFLKDRTRILVTHNMSLTVSSADYVICLHSTEAVRSKSSALPTTSRSAEARSQVVACCPPQELPAVLRSLKCDANKFAGRGAEDDFSVFLDGLAAACLLPPLVPSPSEVSSKEAIQAALPQQQFIQPVSPIEDSDLESEGTVQDSLQDEPVRSTLRPNFSYKSLRAGFQNAPPSPDKSHIFNIGAVANLSPPIMQPLSTSTGEGGIVVKEGKSVGVVGWEMYWFYFKACGGALAVIGIVGTTALCSLAWLFQNISLGEWMYAMENDGSYRSQRAFEVYALSVLIVLASFIVRTVTQVTANLTSSRKLHDLLITSVINAPCSWFDATPVGRIVNRFSQDIATVDSSIILQMFGFMDKLLSTVQIVIIICVSLPVLMLPLLPVVGFTWWVARQYLHVSRELKRLESLKKSPVFVLFSETLQGLAIVRAFRAEGRFFRMCCDRLDEMNRCHIYLWISNRWLSFRMQFLGAIVAGLVGLAVVMESGRIGSTMAGVVLIYSLSFCESLTFLARQHASVQMDLNSIERIQEYSSLACEKSVDISKTLADDDDARAESGVELTAMDTSQHPLIHRQELGFSSSANASNHWPNSGCVEFRNIILQYQSTKTPVLRDVSFRIEGRTKLGVVGRTGAGKSSLIAALFRLVEPSSGELLIDGVDVLNIPLYELRNNIAIVPQEPTLFRGSVRFNLDPFDQHTDEELWAALTSAHLAEHIRSMPCESDSSHANPSNSGNDNNGSTSIDARGGSLANKLVAEKGSNFSLGQRQLLCMARAILRKASVLVLDECTASVDHETDALIQETVRRELGNCTVICIAHRLHTIAYYDNVLVMDQGRVAECAEPLQLMNQKESLFYQMCMTSGDFDELYALAQEASAQRAQLQTHIK